MEISYNKDSSSDSSEADQVSIIDSEDTMLLSDQEGSGSSAEEEEVKNNSMELEDQLWKKITENDIGIMNNDWLKPFSETVGFNWNSMEPEPTSPFDCFKLFMNDEIMKLIFDQTTLYLNQFLDKYQDQEVKVPNIYKNLTLNYEDIWLFIGVTIYMGIVKLPSYRYHWRIDSLFGTSIIPKIMSRDQFDLIKKFFHLNDNNLANPNDKLYKIRTYLSRSIYLWKKFFLPNKALCIDEKMIPWKGRTKWKQYAPLKPTKFGFKVFVLCDSVSNYIYNVDVYTGKKELPTKNLGSRTVKDLISGLENRGHILYMDNFYSSVDLFRDLEAKMIGCSGTIRKNRKGLPSELKTTKLIRGDTLHLQSGNLIAMKWKDKKDVFMLTNCDYGSSIDYENNQGQIKKRPYPIVQYNRQKGGVDLVNQYTAYYANEHRTYKYWFRIFTAIMDISLYNAFVINCQTDSNTKKNGFLEFRIKLCKEIFSVKQNFIIPNTNLNRIALDHKSDRGTQRRCKICSTKEKPKSTKKICQECNVNLCSESCWVLWHTKKSIKKRNKTENILQVKY